MAIRYTCLARLEIDDDEGEGDDDDLLWCN
jgi:hypothetical protein